MKKINSSPAKTSTLMHTSIELIAVKTVVNNYLGRESLGSCSLQSFSKCFSWVNKKYIRVLLISIA